MIVTWKNKYCDMDLGYCSDGENNSPPKRSLDVDLVFPTRMMSTRTQEVPQTLVKQGEDLAEEEEEEEEMQQQEVLSQTLKQREKTIQENKAMLAKLLSELTPLNTPQKKKRTPRKPRFKPEIIIRMNLRPRKGRPVVNFSMEENSVSPGLGERGAWMTDIKRLVEVDEEHVENSRKRCIVKQPSPSVVRSVEEITKEDLNNVAYCRQDKIWHKKGTYCHQCRQKTLDTKTSCRSGVCEGVKGQLCGPCLKSRYGEDVQTVLLDPTWSCPKCRGMCNCSLCRRREGRRPTGVLTDLAGHDNAHEYLQWIQKEQTGGAQ